jgi:pimeloyl-ACP methyl ester carboxylesterase
MIRYGERGPLLVALHWLGGSARTWNEVGELLAAKGYRFVALDLPGFGHAVDASAFNVSAMVAEITATIAQFRENDHEPWVLVGHSMGGKLAAIVARSAEDRVNALEGLAGLVLVSPSSAGPEPMKESKRKEMLETLGHATPDSAEDSKRAKKFVEDNTGKLPLIGPVLQRAVEDVLRMNRSAFVAWLKSGSKEDWGERVGQLDIPALIMAGTEEEALGPQAQETHTMPHFKNASLVPLQGGGHLGPLERPYEVAEHTVQFLKSIDLTPHLSPRTLGPQCAALIESDVTSPQTRKALEQRLTEPQPLQNSIFSDTELSTLRRLSELIIPNAGFDLSTRLQDLLSSALRDGWRFDSLPEDIEAWRLGLGSLEAASLQKFHVPFIALDSARQNTLLQQAQDGEVGAGLLDKLGLPHHEMKLTAQQMRDWLEDVRGELVKIYVSDPRTMERIGFTGFADEKGFTQIRLNESEAFEV